MHAVPEKRTTASMVAIGLTPTSSVLLLENLQKCQEDQKQLLIEHEKALAAVVTGVGATVVKAVAQGSADVKAHVTKTSADVIRAIIAHNDNSAERAYPCVYMLFPKLKQTGFNFKSLIDGVKSIGVNRFSCYCMCEFQCVLEDGHDVTALWHTVANAGQPYCVEVQQPKEVITKMRTLFKATALALKIGAGVAHACGIPVPDLSSFVPQDVLDFGGQLASALQGSKKLAVEDSDIVAAAENGDLSNARLRPTMLNDEQRDMAKKLFSWADVG